MAEYKAVTGIGNPLGGLIRGSSNGWRGLGGRQRSGYSAMNQRSRRRGLSPPPPQVPSSTCWPTYHTGHWAQGTGGTDTSKTSREGRLGGHVTPAVLPRA